MVCGLVSSLPVSVFLPVNCESTFPQGHLREGKCHLSLGNAMAASRCFHRVLELEPDNSQAQQEVGQIDSLSGRLGPNSNAL